MRTATPTFENFSPTASHSAVRAMVRFCDPVVDVDDVPASIEAKVPQRSVDEQRDSSRGGTARRWRALLASSVGLGVAVAASPWVEPLAAATATTALTAPWTLQFCLGGLVTLGGLMAHGRVGKLQHRAERAEAERDRLREFEMRALMVRGAAHDLKNLCVPLVVASDLLAEDLGNDASEELGSYIQTAADHATALLDRLVRADVDGHHTPVRCIGGEEIRRLKPLLARSLERRDHRFTCDIGDAAQVRVDRLDLAQALVNLVTNAGYVREAPVHVRVRGYVEHGRWCVEVRDDAGGIPVSVADRLFEEGTTARDGGTGIGLALTRHLVERNDGTIEVDTDEVGTRFTLRFPLRHQGRSA